MLAVDDLLAMPADVIPVDWSAKDTILYNLGIGFGPAAIADPGKLRFVLEDRLVGFPTIPTVWGMSMAIFNPKFGLDYTGVLHGEEWVTIHRPLPTQGKLISSNTVENVWDRGAEKGAILQMCKAVTLQGEDEPIAETRTVLMLRKNGGFGGSEEGAPSVTRPPERAPDTSITIETQPDQALIYRLSGDLNPLHADPEVAKKAGFPAPILHGMATYGVVARAVVEGACGGDESRLTGYGMRFSNPVYPGETLRTDIWDLGDGNFAFQATAIERDKLVASGGRATIRT